MLFIRNTIEDQDRGIGIAFENKNGYRDLIPSAQAAALKGRKVIFCIPLRLAGGNWCRKGRSKL